MGQPAPQSNALQSELKNPILDIAASFWDDERYRAFRVCYRSMRELDDIVDDLKVMGLAGDAEIRAQALRQLRAIVQLLESNERAPLEIQELRETLNEFKIPLEPWLKLARSMEFDLEHSGFSSFLQFARYAKGAAVAPASVFIHLTGLSCADGHYTPAPIDIFQAARPLAMFSYLTHILRDFRQDTAEGLQYFADDVRQRFEVTEEDWRSSAEGAQTARFTAMIRHYHSLAERYRLKSVVESNPVYPFLNEDTRFSLHLIWELYSQIHEAIAKSDFRLDPELIHPTRSEIYERVMNLAGRMNVAEKTLERGLNRVGFVET